MKDLVAEYKEKLKVLEKEKKQVDQDLERVKKESESWRSVVSDAVHDMEAQVASDGKVVANFGKKPEPFQGSPDDVMQKLQEQIAKRLEQVVVKEKKALAKAKRDYDNLERQTQATIEKP